MDSYNGDGSGAGGRCALSAQAALPVSLSLLEVSLLEVSLLDDSSMQLAAGRQP
jgi:hypothetical protein